MEVPINIIAIVLAAVSTMVVGSIWYAPKILGNTWMQLAKVSPNKSFSRKQMTLLYGGAFLTSLVTACILAYFTAITHLAFGGSLLLNALLVGFMGWLGFTAARIYMHDSFEGRRKKLTLLNITHECVTIMVMALIIGLFGV
jgi:uncharacterized membrane protein